MKNDQSPEVEQSIESVDQVSIISNVDAADAARVAFGRYLKPDFYVDDPTFETLTEADKHWFSPTQIERALFRPPANTSMTVRIDPGDWRSPKLSLNHEEFKIIGRFPEKLAEGVMRQVLAAGDVDEDRVEKAQRGRLHAVTSKQEDTQEHLDKMLERIEQYAVFAAKAHAAGWAHLRSHEMQELFNLCSQELTTIMDIFQIREGWSDEYREKRYAGMMYYLTQGDQRTRVDHWEKTIGTVRRYLASRIRLFENHLMHNQQWLDKQPIPASMQAAESDTSSK